MIATAGRMPLTWARPVFAVMANARGGYTHRTPTAECRLRYALTWNGIDNDCDLAVDEDFTKGDACTVGVGRVERSATKFALTMV